MAGTNKHPALEQALQFHAAGRLREAEQIYRQVLEREPQNHDALHLLGVIAMQCGQFTAAIDLMQRAIRLRPDVADFYSNLGNAYKSLRQFDQAVDSYRTAVRLNPNLAGAYSNLGATLAEVRHLDEAVGCFEQAIRVQPDFAEAHNNLGNAMKDQGRIREAVNSYRQAISLKPDYVDALGNLAFSLCFHDGVSPDDLLKAHRDWAHHHETPLLGSIAPHANDRNPDRRLRIGYISPDFKNHPVGLFLRPLFEHRDRSATEVICYADVPVEDEITHELRSASDGWNSITGATDDQLAEAIRAHGIDILVDLAGHTAGGRLRTLARKPAPVQVTYLGYPATTGLSSIDYRITDSIADPPGASETQHTEQLVRIDPCFLCYRISNDIPAVGPLPALRNGRVTFGCFNNLAKVSDQTIAMWSEILAAVPSATLVVKALALKEQPVRDRTRERFRLGGIAADRITLLPPRPLSVDHFNAYNEIDIALDTHPYNGTTTTCEALSMGVPVVCMTGGVHASRVSASILSAVGLHDFVATDSAGYVCLAVQWAQNISRLAEIRSGLRERMKQSALCDENAFAKRVETAYRSMWRNWCAGGGR